MSDASGKWVALLRGINVGGANKVPMAELRKLCEGLGWTDVQSYIASGNLVFRAEGEGGELSAALQEAMAREMGVEVPILVLPAWMVGMLADQCPYDPQEPKHVHIFFLWEDAETDWALYRDLKIDSEELQVDGRVAWLHTPEGMARSKLAEKLQKVLGSDMTGRNLNTLRKLAEMVG